MATRDVTDKFLALRRKKRGGRGQIAPPRAKRGIVALEDDGRDHEAMELQASQDAESGLGEPGAHSGLAVPPGWLQAVDDVHYEIQRIKTKLTELAAAHKEHLTPQFSEETSGEQTVEILTDQITQMFRTAKNRAQKIGSTELQALSIQFRKAQKDYLGRVASRQSRGGQLFSFNDDGFDDDTAPGAFDVEFTKDQAAALQEARFNVDEREREIKNIARSINDLAEIFRDLATLVAEQGTVLDRIDYNIEQTHHYVEEGVKELVKAKESQKSYTKKTCMMLLCVGILIMVVVVMVIGIPG